MEFSRDKILALISEADKAVKRLSKINGNIFYSENSSQADYANSRSSESLTYKSLDRNKEKIMELTRYNQALRNRVYHLK